MEPLKIFLFGSPVFQIGDEEVDGFNSNKTRALLCYLAVTGQRFSRPRLAGLFWGELPEEKAQTNLRKSVANLRKQVGGYLEITRQTVGVLAGAAMWVDTAAFEEMTAEVGDLERVREGLELYKGAFLEGFFLSDTPEFERWVLAQRERLRRQAAGCVEVLLADALARLESETAVGYAQRLVGMEPWREEVYRQLMVLYARLGQGGAAAKAFVACREGLATELGQAPSPETVGLHERIQRVFEGYTHGVPAAAGPIIGRERELAAVERLLLAPEIRLVTVVATGGMGKTRLALGVGERLVAQRGMAKYWDGVFFVPLAAVSAAEHIVSAIASTFNLTLQERPDRTPQEQLFEWLAARHVLLILDNFEHVLERATFVAELLTAAPHIDILVTSRERLKLRPEQVFPLWGLDQAFWAAVDPSESRGRDSFAAELFVRAARRLRPDFGLSAEDEGALAEICELLQGMPLALELAATWVDTLSLADIAAEIKQGLDILATDLRDMPLRHRSMRAIFESSWVRLSVEGQKLCAALAVFRGGCTREAAEVVAGATRVGLAQLVNQSLLHFEWGAERYQMHELIQQFAALKLGMDKEWEAAVRQRHSAYFARLLQSHHLAFSEVTPKKTGRLIEADLGNIRRGWQEAVRQGDWEVLGEMVVPLAAFYEYKGWLSEGERVFGRAVTAVAAEEVVLRVELMTHQANFLILQGAVQDAAVLLEAALAMLAGTEASRQKAHVFHNLSMAVKRQGHYEAAQQLLEQALAQIEGLDEPWWEANMYNSLGVLNGMRGDVETAAEQFLRGIALCEQHRFWRRLSYIESNFGILFCVQGKFVEGRRHFEKALATARPVQDDILMVNLLNNLGEVSCEADELDGAWRYFQEGMEVAKRIENRYGMVGSVTGLGRVSLLRGAVAEAREHFAEALRIGQTTHMVPLLLESVMWHGKVLAQQGDDGEAVVLLAHVVANSATEQIVVNAAEGALGELRGGMGEARWEELREVGGGLGLDEVVSRLKELGW